VGPSSRRPIAEDRAALPPTLEAPSRARRWIGWLRPHLPPEAAGDLEIVVSELVTNAVLHAGLSEHNRIEVSARLYEDCVSITVCDNGRGIPADVSTALPEAARLGQRGMFLVHRLSARVLIDGPLGKVSVQLPRR
jgi:anti-sigma regulatory factor (Ser/Thr protein kinase)